MLGAYKQRQGITNGHPAMTLYGKNATVDNQYNTYMEIPYWLSLFQGVTIKGFSLGVVWGG